MLRIMLIMITMIATVNAIKPMMINIIMMIIIMVTMIQWWSENECLNYSTYMHGSFLDFSYHFVTLSGI